MYIVEMSQPEEIHDGVLTTIFRTSATARILDFFLDHREFDYPIAEIAKKSGLSLRTVVREVPRLEGIGLIINHRKVGKATMYRLDIDLEAVTLLDKFALDMSQKKSLNEPQRMNDFQDVIEPLQAE